MKSQMPTVINQGGKKVTNSLLRLRHIDPPSSPIVLLCPFGPVRTRSPAFALPSSLFAHLLLHCPVRYSLTCFCTAQFAIRSPAFALRRSTGPSRVESSHRTFSCRKQPQDLLVSKAATGPSRVESSPSGKLIGMARTGKPALAKSAKIIDFSVASSFAIASFVWKNYHNYTQTTRKI